MARLDWDNKGGHKTTHAYLEVTPRWVGSQLQWPAQNHSLMCNGLLHVTFSASFQSPHSGQQVSGTMDRSIGRCQVLSSTRPYCKKWQLCNSTKAIIKSQLHNGEYKVHAIAPFALLIQKFKLSQVSLTVTSAGQWPVSWKFWVCIITRLCCLNFSQATHKVQCVAPKTQGRATGQPCALTIP